MWGQNNAINFKSSQLPSCAIASYSYDEASLTFPLGEIGKSAATQVAVSSGGNDYMPKSGGLASRGDTRVWGCVSHVDCSAKVKVVSTDRGFELHCSTDAHGEVRAALPKTFKGVSAEFSAAIKELVGQGFRPSRIRAELIVQCGADESKKGRIPDKPKIAARRLALSSSPEFQFGTFAVMNQWALDKLIDSREKFEAVKNMDQVLVLSIFHDEIEDLDESEGAADGATITTSTFGFICATKNTLHQLRDVRQCNMHIHH